MKYLLPIFASLLICLFSLNTIAQENTGQCSYDYPTVCGVIATLTYPCSWQSDEELVFMLEDQVDDYYCP